MSDEEKLPLVHKIGSTRSIQSAVLVCEYLRAHCAVPHSFVHPSAIYYHFTEPTDRNGWWSADILVRANRGADMKALDVMVDICRAFVAGRGEIW